MDEADLILRFEIEVGKTPDAENVARALLAWIDVLKTAGAIVEPGTDLQVGLVGVEDGSDIFKLSLRKVRKLGQEIKQGAEDFPLVSKAAISLGGLVGSTLVIASITNAVTPDPRIPDDQMAVIERSTELMEESVELQKVQMRYYGILQDEPAIESIDVIRPFDNKIIYTVPRHEFAERSGLWSGDAEEEIYISAETRTVTWDVVLIRPVLVPEPRRWGFAKDGIEFSALMSDRHFLVALHDKTLQVQMAEGIRMRIEVKYREEHNGEAWIPVPYSHRVTRVLDPLPPAAPAPLFANPGPPKK